MSRLDNLSDRAARYGLQVDSWSPGDGKKRFQFLATDTGHQRGYVLTISNAENWLDAYATGFESNEVYHVTRDGKDQLCGGIGPAIHATYANRRLDYGRWCEVCLDLEAQHILEKIISEEEN